MSPSDLIDSSGKKIDILSWTFAEISTEITPEIAAQLLSRNAAYNRNVRENRVKALVDAMTNGEFVDTGATISVANTGTVIDGQHRLTACAKAGVPFRAVVVTGLPEAAYDATDKGAKRSIADTLKRHGFISTTRTAALARVALSYDEGVREGHILNGTQSEGDIVKYALDHRDELTTTVKKPSLIEQVVVGRASDLVLLLTHRANPEDALVFENCLRDGSHVEVDEDGEETTVEVKGLALVRDALMRDRISHNSKGPFWQIGVLLRAWNLWQEGMLSDKRAPVFTPGGSKANKLPMDLL